MPMPCYLYVEGTNQGKIEGSCRVTGHEWMIIVQGLDHTVSIPKNPQTGLPSGKRVHEAMTMTKEIDKSSPKLLSSAYSSAGTVSATSACKDAPTWPVVRKFSMSLFTASRTARMRVHLANRASSGAANVA